RRISTSDLRRPLLGAMQHSYDLNDSGTDPVNRDEWQASDHQLARSRDAAAPAHFREALKLAYRSLDCVTHVDRRPRIFFSDVLDNARHVVFGPARPSQPHTNLLRRVSAAMRAACSSAPHAP